ncbi:MAG TPA: DNA primase [Bryobacteraceae bacterium]|nr:DNA primase [Bryobacteraceae bacterium]
MDFVDHLKSSVDIVRTVGEYVRLRKVGARYSGLCPFHTEKTPSFSVNPAIGIFICFGCGKKGDVLTFVQEMEQLTFFETLKLLAERNGIPMPTKHDRKDPDTDLRAAIYEIHDLAAAAFKETLWGANGGEAREYLRKRGLSQRIAEEFSLGLAERAGQDLLRRLKPRFSPDELEKSGLFGKREEGGLYDRFRGRLMFPIHSESGKVIAFGGRAMRPEDEPKYLNSPETTIYKKRSVLYNLHRAKGAIRTTERAVLVEGYMDVIGVYSAGVKQVVASCGTALSNEQVRNIKRHSDSIVVNFDPDKAGANATEKSIQILLDEGMHVRVLELAGGLDPDEFIKANGAEAYNARLQRATGYFLWLADRARRNFDMTTAEGRIHGFETVLLPTIRKISDKLERAAVAGEVAEYLGVDRALVLKEFRSTPGTNRGPAAAKKVAPPSYSMTERVLVRSLFCGEETRDAVIDVLRRSEAVRRYAVWPILQAALACADAAEPVTFEAVEQRVAEPAQKTLLSSLIFADTSDETLSRDQVMSCLEVLDADDTKLREQELRAQVTKAERSGNWDEALRLNEQLTILQRTRARKR